MYVNKMSVYGAPFAQFVIPDLVGDPVHNSGFPFSRE